jgi:hypothetical protein
MKQLFKNRKEELIDAGVASLLGLGGVLFVAGAVLAEEVIARRNSELRILEFAKNAITKVSNEKEIAPPMGSQTTDGPNDIVH